MVYQPKAYKVCHRCGRVGTRNFIWLGEHYECQYDMSCRARIATTARRTDSGTWLTERV